jgi:hypothetical protein
MKDHAFSSFNCRLWASALAGELVAVLEQVPNGGIQTKFVFWKRQGLQAGLDRFWRRPSSGEAGREEARFFALQRLGWNQAGTTRQKVRNYLMEWHRRKDPQS